MSIIAPIAWILIGLMVGGSLIDYLAATQESGMCVELRELEQEDDRTDLSDLVYVSIEGGWTIHSDNLSEEISDTPRLDIWSAQQAARYERGPPSLVLACA